MTCWCWAAPIATIRPRRRWPLAAELDAGLIAMGCYGHGRTREWVLGGASRTVLREAARPVLMVH